ncbi:hypothetical protein [Nitratireductor sp. ZSWI3]|uniref:hypothetical protein n=1 Tax=Nitratireductor sp. ZSWI3 TaxID=2966359 RepID=UPI002150261A|nr:hypothetical protein [Nitratireductor sp. ZSWI3]MCR4264547.1 hypothetical protein [Nitratireductor sp. ZSWI3]
MSAAAAFFREAAARYRDANAATLRWMLDRPPLGPGFLNTKMNSLTLVDYEEADGLRGPSYTYGWIQGRGLEALATHAAFFASRDPALTQRLDHAGRRLYVLLQDLRRVDGHVYFRHDADLAPVRAGPGGEVASQDAAGDIFTYSDAFAAKGLIAAAARYAPEELPRHLAYLAAVIEAIEDGRFQIDEQARLGGDGLRRQPDDFGPRMILLGAAGLLGRLDLHEHTGFAGRFIDHVLDRHLDPATSLLRNEPGGDACNVGHGIEFAGFALEHLSPWRKGSLVAQLERILIASFNAGFHETGLNLAVSVSTGAAISPYRPWWSLPETVRAAALAHAATGNPESLSIWQRADAAFFRHYWRGEPPLAYQTRTADGPVDHVPATPDLDPGYHTGLSLLGALHVAEAASPAHSVHAER